MEMTREDHKRGISNFQYSESSDPTELFRINISL